MGQCVPLEEFLKLSVKIERQLALWKIDPLVICQLAYYPFGGG